MVNGIRTVILVLEKLGREDQCELEEGQTGIHKGAQDQPHVCLKKANKKIASFRKHSS